MQVVIIIIIIIIPIWPRHVDGGRDAGVRFLWTAGAGATISQQGGLRTERAARRLHFGIERRP